MAPVAGECITWGGAGALLGGVGGFAAGCAAGAASYVVAKYAPEGPGKVLAQCGIWAAGAVASAPRALGRLAIGGLAGTGCIAGAASGFDPYQSDASACGIWGAAGAAAGVISRSAGNILAVKALVGCAAGIIGGRIDGGSSDHISFPEAVGTARGKE